MQRNKKILKETNVVTVAQVAVGNLVMQDVTKNVLGIEKTKADKNDPFNL